MTRAVRLAVIAALVVTTLGLGATKAAASSVQYNFDVANGFGGAGSSPYGRLTLTEAGAGDILVIVELFNGLQFVSAFDVTVGFNLDGISAITYSGVPSGWTINNVVGTNGQNAGSYNVDGYGQYEFGISSPGSGGSNPQPSPISFHVLATGITLDSFKEKSTGGGTAEFFAADVLGTGANGSTGAIAISGAPHVVPSCLTPPCTGDLPQTPEPATLVLFGTGLIGAVTLIRRRKAN